MRTAALITPLLVGIVGCTVSADLAGKSCPCAPGWTCDEASGACVVGSSSGDASPDGDGDVDADADADTDVDTDVDADVDTTFTDDSAATFGSGSFVGTRVDSDAVELQPGVSVGEFLSRVFDAHEEVTWTTLRWTPRAPYEKPLPDDGAAETGYAEGDVDMDSTILLLHFELSRPLGDGERTTDASGLGNNPIVLSAGTPLRTADGRVDLAAADRRDTYLSIPLSSTDDFEFGTDDFTWALWINTIEDCTERNRVYMGVEGDTSDTPHLWLGCTSSDGTHCPPGDIGGRAGGTFHSTRNPADGTGFCGLTTINDGRWHHIVLVKSGHEASTISLYVDGELDTEETPSFTAPIAFPSDPDFGIGGFTDWTYPALGLIDEVAIWRRALSEDEVRAVYLRGALRLRLQVRACDAPDCSDAPVFVGPDGSQETFFVDRRSPAGSTIEHDLPPLTGRYIQYRAMLASDASGETPTLEAVTIAGVSE